MIPKIIHCCWLSGEPKTELAEKCLASWRKHAPGWEIREWDIERINAEARRHGEWNVPFFRDAVRARKWAFAADWVRVAVLKECGGVYFDYDFELVKPISELPDGEWCAGQRLSNGCVAPEPAAIALEKDSSVAQAMLDYYAAQPFGTQRTVGEILEEVKSKSEEGKSAGSFGIRVLEPEVMSPIGVDGKMHRTEKTVGIHWYAMSWASPQRKIAKWLSWHGLRPIVDILLRLHHGKH